ncbi:MAG: pyridoxamine 5'-phosphate oxidase [Alphaproteobacteria bacterium]|nr:pyridoxamine 5'-phosphate oxidase [Alphaproteobacteria bacterium]
MENNDPFSLFNKWYEEACEVEPSDPNAMALATVNETGYPNVRIVLLKEFSREGFIFYTNFESTKGRELLKTLKAAAVFHWKSLAKQIRIQGDVETINNEQADQYFHSRPRLSQIGAWASKQSRSLESEHALEKNLAYYTTKFAIGPITRPPYWSGFRIIPKRIEFWQEGKFRLHKRSVFIRQGSNNWINEKLYP